MTDAHEPQTRPESPPQRESAFANLINAQKRQARAALADLLRVRGLMPLLMKHRNGGTWTRDEKAELLAQLRLLSRLSPYLLFLLLPGSALLLPMYAWWLDHRRLPRADAPVPRQTTEPPTLGN